MNEIPDYALLAAIYLVPDFFFYFKSQGIKLMMNEQKKKFHLFY